MKQAIKFFSSVALFLSVIALTGCCGNRAGYEPCAKPCSPQPYYTKPYVKNAPRPCAPAPVCDPVCY